MADSESNYAMKAMTPCHVARCSCPYVQIFDGNTLQTKTSQHYYIKMVDYTSKVSKLKLQ